MKQFHTLKASIKTSLLALLVFLSFTAKTQTWQSVGGLTFSGTSIDAPCLVVHDSVPFVSFGYFYDNILHGTLMKLEGGNWVTVGNTPFSGGHAYYTSLAFSGNTPFVAYKDNLYNNKTTVKKYDGANWVTVGTEGFSSGTADYVSLAMIDSTPYVAYCDVDNGNKTTVMKFDGSNWVTIGGAGFTPVQTFYQRLVINNGSLYVAFDHGGSNVMKFNGTNWEYVGNSGFGDGSSHHQSLAFSGNTPYVAFQDFTHGNKTTVMKLAGNTWVNLGNPGFSDGYAIHQSLGFIGSTPYVAYYDGGNGGGCTAKSFNGEAWVNVGNPGFGAGSTGNQSLGISGNTLYVAYRDYGIAGRGSVKKFDASVIISGNNIPISDGDTIPSVTDNTDFGIGYLSSPITKSFTIDNKGNSPLTISSITLSDNTNFTVSALNPATPIAANSSATFTVTMNAATYGTKNCSVTINSDNAFDGVFNFSIKGKVNCAGSTFNATQCDHYVLPWGDTATSSDTYQHTYHNPSGCDSVVTVNLTINHSSNNSSKSNAYISNGNSNTVSVVDLTTNLITATINVGSYPTSVCASADGSKVFVINYYGNTVSAIDALTNTVVATIPVGYYPSGICMSPDGTKVYVTNFYSGSVSVINTATNTVSTSISIAGYPNAICISPDGSKLFVSDYYSSTINVINTVTNNIDATATGGYYTGSMAVSPDGTKLYGTDGYSNQLFVINTATNAFITTIATGSYPSALCISADGSKIYVSNYYGNSVSVIAAISNTIIATVAVGSSPGSVSLNGNGSKLYVINNGDNNISVVNTSTNTVSATITAGSSVTAGGNFIVNVSNDLDITVNNMYTWNGTTYTTSGTYTYAATNSVGCDSILTLYLVINHTIDSSSFSLSACEYYILPWADTVTITGDYIHTYQSANGGDSIVTAHVTILHNTRAQKLVAYIPHRDFKTLSIIDISNNTPTEKIFNVGQSPYGVGVSPDGSSVYVTDVDNDSISVINTITKTIIARIKVGYNPFSVCISRDGSKIYVPNRGSNSISVINAYTNTVINTIPISVPNAINISPDGNTLYVAHTIGGHSYDIGFSIISTATNTVIATFTNGYASAIAVSPDGSRVYFPDMLSGILKVLETATNTIIAQIQVGNLTAYPQGVCVSPDGSKIYVAIENAGSIKVIDAATNTVTATIAGQQGTQDLLAPSGLCMNADGTILYVESLVHGNITLINTLTNSIINTIINTVDPLYNPPYEKGAINFIGYRPLTQNVTACNPYTLRGKIYTTPGIYYDTIANAAGCDSIITFNLTLLEPSTPTAFAATSCDNYLLPWDTTVTASGAYSHTYHNIHGCDSVVTANVTINNSSPSAKAYIPNLYDNTVSVINTTTNTVIKTIPVGMEPSDVAVSPDGSRVYISNHGSNEISVINTATNIVIATIAFGINLYPTSLIVSPDGTKVYVSMDNIRGIAIINAVTNTLSTIVPGNYSGTLTISPDGSNLYISNYFSSIETVFSTVTLNTITTIPVGVRPWSSAMSRDGTRQYVPCEFENSVNVINTATNTVIATIAVGNGPLSVCINADGSKLYVANYYSKTISVVSTVSNTVITTIQLGTEPYVINITPDGTMLYVTQFEANSVTVISTANNSIVTYIGVGAGPTGRGNFIANLAETTPQIACGSFTWHGTTYTQSGTYHFTEQNAAGCDSVVALNLTVKPLKTWRHDADQDGYYTDTAIISCDSVGVGYVVEDSTHNHIDSVDCNDHDPNAHPGGAEICDNGIDDNCNGLIDEGCCINLNTAFSDTSCDSYHLPWDSTTTLSGTYVHTFHTAQGCDSIVTANIIVKHKTYTNLNKAYVTSTFPGFISVIDLHTNTIIKKIPFPGTNGITVSKDGSRAYVTSSYAIGVINTTLDTVVAIIHLANAAVQVCISNDGTKLYTTSSEPENKLTVVNTLNYSTIAIIQMPGYCKNISISPDDSRLFVCNGSNKLSIVNTATNTIVSTISLGSRVNSSAVAPDGTKVYVSCAGSVSVVSLITNSVIEAIVTNHDARTICVNSTGTKVYTIDDALVDILDLTTFTISRSLYIENGVDDYSTATVSDDDSKLYLQNYFGNLTVINTTTYNITSVNTGNMYCNASGNFIAETHHNDSVSSCTSYTWNGVTYTQSGTYSYTTTGASGCDSIATIHLNIKPLKTWYEDADNDGYYTGTPITACDPPSPSYYDTTHIREEGPLDCNDHNPLAYPGAADICGNGIDENCNGTADEAGCCIGKLWYLDADHDGYYVDSPVNACTAPTNEYRDSVLGGNDCNDHNPFIHPNAQDIANDGIDENCDGTIDGPVTCNGTYWYLDADGDNYYSGLPVLACTSPGLGYYPKSSSRHPGDCNDNNPRINPGTLEICGNGIDDNCNGQIDEYGCCVGSNWYLDADGDGYFVGAPVLACSSPGIFYIKNLPPNRPQDCNDTNPFIHPGAQEICGNGIDDNCNGQIDEDGCCIGKLWYKDGDHDGYYAGNPVLSCTRPGLQYIDTIGYGGHDCNDANPAIHPNALEVCSNSLDDNCNGEIDEGIRPPGCCEGQTWYLDADGDGYPSLHLLTCSKPAPGYILTPAHYEEDCDDNNPIIHPNAQEICGNGIDDNCNGQIDEGGCCIGTLWYKDADHDGYGITPVLACSQPDSSFVNIPPAHPEIDCDDNNVNIHPGALEIIGNGIDDNCNDSTDEHTGCEGHLYYLDADGDGYTSGVTILACAPPLHYFDSTGIINPHGPYDCNDHNIVVHPGAAEICGNGIDDNCNGQIDEVGCCIGKNWYVDADGDGYYSSVPMLACTRPDLNYKDSIANNEAFDCDDHNPLVHPGATEVCGNGIDDNCNGLIDEVGCCIGQLWYLDVDHDGYPDGHPILACNPGVNYTATILHPNEFDCNDLNAAIHPGATEICGNGIDDNCDGIVDEGCCKTKHSSFAATNCDSYTLPWGTMVTTTGTYTHTYKYGNDCDSIVTANITIKYSSAYLNTMAYVPNFDSHNLSVVNISTGNLVTTIPLPSPGYSSPLSVDINTYTGKVYVTNLNGNVVHVINTLTNLVEANISIPGGPWGVAVNNNGSKVYVSNSNLNRISVINATTNVIEDTIHVGNYPSGICLTKDGTKLYVANQESGSVSVINTLNNSIIATIPGIDLPNDISLSEDETKLFVTRFGGLVVINTSNNTVTSNITVGTDYSLGVAASIDGNKVYVSNNDTVIVVNANSNTIIKKIKVGVFANGLCISPDGTNLYVANRGTNTVSVISTATDVVVNTITVGLHPVGFGKFVANVPVALAVTSCKSYFWNGTNYTQSGKYTFSTLNAVGCDSTVTLNLTITDSTFSDTSVVACDTYQWHGTNYTTSGNKINSTTSVNGCINMETLHLTIKNSTSSTTPVTVCSNTLPYVWNGNNYNAAGTYNIHLTNSQGCDSMASLNLTVNNPTNWYLDADGDGYYTGTPVFACTKPANGYVTSITGSGDCNDSVAAIRPNAIEICGNGIDENCNGMADDVCFTVSGTVTNTLCPGTNMGAINLTITGGAAPFRYQWNNGNPNQNISGLAAGNYIVFVTDNNNKEVSKSFTVGTIQPTAKPVAPGIITGVSSVCPGETFTYSIAPVANTVSYNWIAPANTNIVSGQGTTSIVMQFLSGYTSSVLSVTAVNCMGVSGAKTLSVALKGKPVTPGVITGPTDVCPNIFAGTTVTYSIAKVANATSYQWSMPDLANAPIVAHLGTGQNDTAIVIRFTSNYTTGSLSVTATNNCGTSNSRSLAITKKAPALPTITGNLTPCQNSTQVYTAFSPTGTSYAWTVSATVATINSGQGTSTLNITFKPAFNTATIGVKTTSVCGTSSKSIVVTKGVTCRDDIPLARGSAATPEKKKADALLDLSIYPNPSKGNFNIAINSIDKINNATVEILNEYGQSVYKQTAVNNDGVMSLKVSNHFSNGLYIVKCSLIDESVIKKLVINR